MPEQRISFQFPLRGLSDDNAYSEQQPLTTREARNVRGIDPVTGRTRGAQRSGLEKFCTTQLDTNHVQDIAVVTRDSPKIDYANLTTGNLTVEWANVTPQEGTTWWPEPDFQGNIVLLDGDNQLAKYNADGVLLRKIAVLAPAGGSVVRKVSVDVDGAAYVAAYASNYTSGTLWKFRDSETDPATFEEAWRIDFTDEAPVMFTLTGNTLYVGVRFGTGFKDYELRRYDGPLTGVPLLGTSVDCPGPINALEVGASGALWLTSEANANRGEGPESNGISRVSRETDLWTPHDLNNAEERLYFWTRADNIDGSNNSTLTDGDEVTDWEDHRFADATATTVLDTTDRKWAKDTGSPARPGPTYRATGWGGYPCIQFDGNDTTAGGSSLPGQALQALANNTATFKTSATATMAGQRALFPGYPANALSPLAGSQFFTVLLVRVTATDEDDGPAVLVSQSARGAATAPADSNGISYGVLTNAEWNTTTQWAANSALIDHETPLGNDVLNATGNATGNSAKAAEGEYDATSGLCMITLVQGGDSNTVASVTRINGRWTDSYTLTGTENYGTTGDTVTILGCRRRQQNQTANSDMYEDGDGYVSFTGEIVEAITVLADSSTGAAQATTHDLSVSHPHNQIQPHGFTGSAGAEAAIAGQRAARFDVLASDVEQVEGYVAHYWGASHILAREFKDAAQTGVHPKNHPYAGTGNYPRKTGSTIDPLTVDKWSPDAVLWRCSPTSLAVTQAIAGGGIGYAVATDEDGDVAVVGPKSGRTGAGTHYGPDNLADETVIARKLEDRLEGIRQDAASYGAIYFKEIINTVSSGAGANDGDTVTIDDGVNPAVTFEFDSNSSVSQTPTLRQVDITGLTLASLQIDALKDAINDGSISLAVTARQNGPLICELFHDSTGANNAAITTNASTRIGVVGLRDGTSATDAWTLSDASNAPDTAGLRMAFDDNGDLWVPQLLDDEDEFVTKLDGTDGSTLVSYDLAGGSEEVTGVALPLSRPSYIGSPSVTGPLFMYLTSTGGASDPQDENLHKIRLVSETQNLAGASTPRATRFLAVVDGNVYEFTNGATVTDVSAANSNRTLVSSSPYISSAVLSNRVVWADGTQYLVYDAQENTLEPLTATKGGTAPRNGRLLAAWNGRLLIARTDDEPYNVFGSRRGDITDWDEFPPVPDYLEAFSFSNSQVGLMPDVVNALMPLDDDLLILGGDNSIFRLTGDPTAGGALDLVSDITGVAYGQPWTKDPSGVLYFFGARGGVYRMAPGGIPERITRDRIERRMADIDLSVYRMRMAYNYRDEGLHVFAVPYGEPSEAPVGWFVDKNGAWWEDSFASTNVAPTAVAVADGDDPDDRVLLIGGGNGYIRKWSGSARDDDGERIDSYVTLGPIAPTQAGREFRFMRPQVVLASDQQGAAVEFFATDDPRELGVERGVAVLGPGMNPRLPLRARGSYLYARLRNAALSERWAYEQGTVGVAPAGRQRVR